MKILSFSSTYVAIAVSSLLLTDATATAAPTPRPVSCHTGVDHWEWSGGSSEADTTSANVHINPHTTGPMHLPIPSDMAINEQGVGGGGHQHGPGKPTIRGPQPGGAGTVRDDRIMSDSDSEACDAAQAAVMKIRSSPELRAKLVAAFDRGDEPELNTIVMDLLLPAVQKIAMESHVIVKTPKGFADGQLDIANSRWAMAVKPQSSVGRASKARHAWLPSDMTDMLFAAGQGGGPHVGYSDDITIGVSWTPGGGKGSVKVWMTYSPPV